MAYLFGGRAGFSLPSGVLATQARVAACTSGGLVVDNPTGARMRMVSVASTQARPPATLVTPRRLVGDVTCLSPEAREAMVEEGVALLVPLRPSSAVAALAWDRATRLVVSSTTMFKPASEVDAAKIAGGFLAPGLIVVEPRSDLRYGGFTHIVAMRPEEFEGYEIYKEAARLVAAGGLRVMVTPYVPYGPGGMVADLEAALAAVEKETGVACFLALPK